MKNNSCVRLAIYVAVVCFAGVLVFAPLLAAQQIHREWTSVSGKFNVTAELLEYDDTFVTLRPNSRESIKIEIEQLSDLDQKLIRGLGIIERDKRQFELLTPHRSRYSESPRAVLEIVKEITRQNPASPYAPIMTGLAYALELGDYDKARKYFKIAENAIDDSQKILGPRYHRSTLSTLHNNAGVASLKARKGNIAARQFLAAVENPTLPFEVYHNATLMMEVTNQYGAYIRLSDTNRKRLVSLLAQKTPVSPGGEVPHRFLYSLNWNEPISIRELEQLVASSDASLGVSIKKGNKISGSVFKSEKQLRDRGYSPFMYGSGFLIANDLMVTNRHVVQSSTNDLSFTITQFAADGSPKLIGGTVVKFSVVDSEDLALVKLDIPLDSVSLPIRATKLADGEELTVFGFPEVERRGEHINASAGNFISYDHEHPWHYCSAQIESGNSGGPCIDMHGNVCGVAFAKYRKVDYEVLGKYWLKINHSNKAVSVSNQALADFMRVARPDLLLVTENDTKYESRQELVEAVRGSIMLVKSWIPPTTLAKNRRSYGSETAKRIVTENVTMQEKQLFPDLWCMTCRGKGWLDCVNRDCHRGGVSRQTTIQAGVNPINGAPYYRSNITVSTCSVCRGKGGRDCPDCVDGKIGIRDR